MCYLVNGWQRHRNQNAFPALHKIEASRMTNSIKSVMCANVRRHEKKMQCQMTNIMCMVCVCLTLHLHRGTRRARMVDSIGCWQRMNSSKWAHKCIGPAPVRWKNCVFGFVTECTCHQIRSQVQWNWKCWIEWYIQCYNSAKKKQ